MRHRSWFKNLGKLNESWILNYEKIKIGWGKNLGRWIEECWARICWSIVQKSLFNYFLSLQRLFALCSNPPVTASPSSGYPPLAKLVGSCLVSSSFGSLCFFTFVSLRSISWGYCWPLRFLPSLRFQSLGLPFALWVSFPAAYIHRLQTVQI